MAINVNTVYTTVLSILNKEQRGYLTPYEFNQIATQVQLEIFEKFFEDYNQYIRMPKTSVDYASRMDHIYEEFQVFLESEPASAVITSGKRIFYALPAATQNTFAVHRLGSVNSELNPSNPELQLISRGEYTKLNLSPLTKPTIDFPVGIYSGDKVELYPVTTGTPAVTDLTFNYIRKPKDVFWNFTTGTLGQYIHSTNSPNQDFEISSSQQTDVIIAILKYAGVVIRDPQIVQSASNLEATNEANTKR